RRRGQSAADFTSVPSLNRSGERYAPNWPANSDGGWKNGAMISGAEPLSINVWPGDELEGPFTRPSGTLSPSEGERDGVRGLFDRFSEPRFLERSPAGWERDEDRKSTRLNSSHLGISYAVFCLKKKKKTKMLCSTLSSDRRSGKDAMTPSGPCRQTSARTTKTCTTPTRCMRASTVIFSALSCNI